MVRELTEFRCTVHYADNQTAKISVFATELADTIPKTVKRAARDKAEHIGERNREGRCASERPNPRYAEIDEERLVVVEVADD